MIFNINQNTTNKEYKPNYLLAELKENVTLSSTEKPLYFREWKRRRSGGLFINNDGTFEVTSFQTFNVDLKAYLFNGFTAGSSVNFYLYDISDGTESNIGRFMWRTSSASPYEHVNIKFPYIESDGDSLYKITANVTSGSGKISVGSVRDNLLLITELFNRDSR